MKDKEITPELEYKTLTKLFFLDVCCLGIWDDKVLEDQEVQFLKDFEQRIVAGQHLAQQSLDDLRSFSIQHAKKVQLFEHANPIAPYRHRPVPNWS